MNSKMLHLRNALCSLYPDVVSIRRLASDCGLEQSRINFATSSINAWHSVLTEAEDVDCISALLDVVDTEYGANQGFRKAYDMYRLSADQINPVLNDDADHNIFMSTVLQSAVVKVTGTRLGAFGTGFAIKRDHQYLYIVTCYHVILEVGGEKTLFIRQIPAELVDYDPEDGLNLALLRVRAEHLTDVPVLPSAQTFLAQQRFQVAGHYRFDKQIPVKTITGRFTHEDALHSEHRNYKSRGWRIQINSTDEILEASLSGGPVVNEAGEVMGIISCKESEGKTGFAVSIEAVAQLQTDLNRSDNHQQKPHNKPVQLRQRNGLYLMNFETELYEFERLIHEPNPTVKLIVVQGPSGSGKTELLRDYRHMIREQRGQEPNWFDLAQQMEVEHYLDDIIDQLGVHWFRNYRAFQRKGKPDPLTPLKAQEWEDNLTREFFDDLRVSGTPNAFFVFFDQYEEADRSLRRWFTETFLPRLNQKPLVVIIAGQKVPTRLPTWESKRQYPLQAISIDWCQRYVKAIGVTFAPGELEIVHDATEGSPKLFVEYINKRKIQSFSIGANL